MWTTVSITNDLLNNAKEIVLYSINGSSPVILKGLINVQFTNGVPDAYNWSFVITFSGNKIDIATQRMGDNAKESNYHPVFTRVYYR